MNKPLPALALPFVLLTIGFLRCAVAQETTAMHRMLVSSRRVKIDGVECRTANEVKHAVADLPSGSNLIWSMGCLPRRELLGGSEEIKLPEFKKYCSEHGVKFIIASGW